MALERETYRKKKKPLQIICWQRLLLLLDETLILSEIKRLTLQRFPQKDRHCYQKILKKINIVINGILKKINIVIINKILEKINLVIKKSSKRSTLL